MPQAATAVADLSPAVQEDRRSGIDRRKQMTSLRQMMFYGQRQLIRRKADQQKLVWVDKYRPSLLILILLVVLLSMADAFLTLYLITQGAREINPIMAYCLSFGPSVFVLVKYVITCASLLVLLVLSNVFIRRIQIYTRSIFPYVIGVFGCVILWELFLIYR